MNGPWYFTAKEDSTPTLLARVTALDASGDEVAPGEGNLIQQDDLTAVTLKVYDLGTNRDAATGTEVSPTPSLTPADNVFDELSVRGWPTPRDRHGWNFRHVIGAAYLADPGEWRLFEYKFTLDDGGVTFLEIRIYTRPTVQS